jgi:hypothetical protein
MKIAFNGCSMVEMGNCDHVDSWESMIWPSLISQNLSAEYLNVATTLASNQRILRTSIDLVLDSTPDILIVGWTSMDRIEMPLVNGDWLRLSPYCSLPEKHGKEANDYEFFYKNYYNDWLMFYQTVQTIYLLSLLCKQNNVKLLMFNAVFHNYINDYQLIIKNNFYKIMQRHPMHWDAENKKVQKLCNLIQNENWLIPSNVTLVDICKSNQWPLDEFGHPTVEAQIPVANFFLDKLNNYL